ncbi:MAG: DUF177 domain-containing protein [Thermoanaerobaculaceae bacterium]|nr:DUF177 domain-containing protein [Thermoanaerobaculaceae bacterium]
MLRIDLTHADTEPQEFDERPVVPPAAGGEDVVSVAPVELSGRVERAGRGYLLEGRVAGSARLRCGRCLAEFDFSFAEPIELHLLPLAAAPQDDETRLGRHELEVRYYAEPSVDLVELAAEQFALVVPMKPLCAEECRGFCARCGANLNLGACSCPPQSTDVRFAPLAGWRPNE